MDTVPLNEVDIKNLIKLSWSQLGILLTGLTPKESNQVINVLFKELETLQSKLIEKHENDVTPKDIDETVGEVEKYKLNLATDIQGESVEPYSEDHFFQENEVAEENLLEDRENKFLSNEQPEIIDNEWYTFVSNANTTEAEKENEYEDDQLKNSEFKEYDELKTITCQKSFAQQVTVRTVLKKPL